MGTRKRRSEQVKRAKMRSPGRPPVLHRSERRPFWGWWSPRAARAKWQLEDLGFHRRSGSGGFGSVEVCPHRNLRRRRRRRRGVICHWLSASKSPSCAPNVTGFARSPGNLCVPRRRSRVGCDSTLPPAAEASSIGRSRHSGMLIVPRGVPSLPSWRSMLP